MSESTEAAAPKAKKSVALSGIAAGNTALCTVGRSGNDLHYRGYDILDIAESCEFEEVAYLLVHGKLPNRAELAGYKARLKEMRGLPTPVKVVLEQLPAASHPMDVMRTGVSALGWKPRGGVSAPGLGPKARPDELVGLASNGFWEAVARGGMRAHEIGPGPVEIVDGPRGLETFAHAFHDEIFRSGMDADVFHRRENDGHGFRLPGFEVNGNRVFTVG